MSLRIDRKCCVCGKVNDNEIYISWSDTATKEEMDKFYYEWKCAKHR